MALLLSGEDVKRLLSMDQAIHLMEEAFFELASGTAVMPQRIAVTDPDRNGWFAFMPAQLKRAGALGIKAVTVYKDNPSTHNLPATLATIVLLDGVTGQTISIMDASYLTAVRTGAVSGLATRLLAREGSRVAGVLGTGVQARTQLWAIASVCKLDKALCFSTSSPDKQEDFAREVSELLDIPVEVATSPRQLVESSDVLALATTAATPVVDWDWVKPGTHINGIGAHTPDVRELDTRTAVRSKIVCDHTPASLAEAGDLKIPIAEGALSPEDVYCELGELVTGAKKGRESDQEVTFFKSVGLSIQDISTAQYVYEQAIRNNVGTQFDF